MYPYELPDPTGLEDFRLAKASPPKTRHKLNQSDIRLLSMRFSLPKAFARPNSNSRLTHDADLADIEDGINLRPRNRPQQASSANQSRLPISTSVFPQMASSEVIEPDPGSVRGSFRHVKASWVDRKLETVTMVARFGATSTPEEGLFK